MPQASEGEVCQAVLNFVTEGAYPEEDVVAAEFPTGALAKELELISGTREQVEVRCLNEIVVILCLLTVMLCIARN